MKGGANCTNTAGSYKCTCQLGHLWNGTICEGSLASLVFSTLNLDGGIRLSVVEKLRKTKARVAKIPLVNSKITCDSN